MMHLRESLCIADAGHPSHRDELSSGSNITGALAHGSRVDPPGGLDRTAIPASGAEGVHKEHDSDVSKRRAQAGTG